MHVPTGSIIHKIQKVDATKCPSTSEQINKAWCTHTMEYYSAVAEKEILTSAVTCVTLEDILLMSNK